ncbi:MYND-type domain-containing protein [Mycena chlorophos]|uniref:MYND-type domain-containing protein n=1 Tax=Mycena chlorophos TaxID=658473 RepID=A0A8H6SVM2_MYCCL|nr:MYND-type domain-containing protein [Mycena chlorophos]
MCEAKFYVGYFYRTQAAGLVCARCFKISPITLLICSACRRLAYCSPACQKQDWKDHKSLCKGLSKVNAYDAERGHTLVDLSRRMAYCVAEEDERRHIFDHPIIDIGPRCQVCFRTPFHDKQHTLKSCGDCKLAWWCSPECEKVFPAYHTKAQCETLCLVRATDTVMLPTEYTQPAYVPPSSLSGWNDYHARNMPHFNDFAASVAAEFVPVHPDAVRAVKHLAIDTASIVLTLLAALEKTLPDLRTRKTLCIHMVGAEALEPLSQRMTEELLHYIPALRAVTIAYVGPNLVMYEDESDTRNLACQDCAPRGRRRFSIRRNTTYHEFAKTPAYRANSPPDLVAGFNTGMGEVDSALWAPSIRFILKTGVPAVFTAYSSPEAMHDTLFLTRLGAKFVLPAETNVWRGVIPSPSVRYEQHGTEHFLNHYWMIVKGSESA